MDPYSDIFKQHGVGLQAYADKLYGHNKRRPWESDYVYNHVIYHVSICVS